MKPWKEQYAGILCGMKENKGASTITLQVEYPMLLPPHEEATEHFIIYGMGAHNGEHFKRIRHA
ncbi:hypothetical protein CR513_44673, partial [Mucuna pruriens]